MSMRHRQNRRPLRSKPFQIDVKEIRQLVGKTQRSLERGDFSIARAAAQALCEKIAPVLNGTEMPNADVDMAMIDNIYLTALVWRVRATSGMGDVAGAEAMVDEYYDAARERNCMPRIVQALQIKAQFALDRADWQAAIDELELLLAQTQAPDDRPARIAALLALANCQTRLYRFSDARAALTQAEECVSLIQGGGGENLPAIWMALYEIEKLTGHSVAARALLCQLGEWIQRGKPCREDDFCEFLLAQIRESSAQFDDQNARDILDMLKSTSIYREAEVVCSPDSNRHDLQRIIIDIEACRCLWAAGDRENAWRVFERCAEAAADRATQQTLVLLRYEWAVETGRCILTDDGGAAERSRQCQDDVSKTENGLFGNVAHDFRSLARDYSARADDPDAMAQYTAEMFDDGCRGCDGNILMRIHRGFIDAELKMECGKYEESSQILNWIREVATFRDCQSIAVRARAMLCQIEICRGSSHVSEVEAVEIYAAMRSCIGELEALPAFLTAYGLCLMEGDLSRLESLCSVSDVLALCAQKFEMCCANRGEPGIVTLGLGLLRVHALQRDVLSFEKIASQLEPYMRSERRAYSSMVFWGICAQFEHSRRRNDGEARRDEFLERVQKVAAINGFDASRFGIGGVKT